MKVNVGQKPPTQPKCPIYHNALWGLGVHMCNDWVGFYVPEKETRRRRSRMQHRGYKVWGGGSQQGTRTKGFALEDIHECSHVCGRAMFILLLLFLFLFLLLLLVMQPATTTIGARACYYYYCYWCCNMLLLLLVLEPATTTTTTIGVATCYYYYSLLILLHIVWTIRRMINTILLK